MSDDWQLGVARSTELADLWRRYKETGDLNARERLVVAYLPLVESVAGAMASRLPAHLEDVDLISYGLVGLISAIERFDLGRFDLKPERRFETYAIARIKGAITDELVSLSWVARSVRLKAREIAKANTKLEHQLQRAPTDEEMAAELQISVEEFQEALRQISNSTVAALEKLSPLSGAGDQASLLDSPQDTDAAEQLVTQSEVKDRLAALPVREKLVLALYYDENLTPPEIGQVLGVTGSCASELHTQAVLRLTSRQRGRSEPSLAGPPDEQAVAMREDEKAAVAPAAWNDASRDDVRRKPGRPPRRSSRSPKRAAADLPVLATTARVLASAGGVAVAGAAIGGSFGAAAGALLGGALGVVVSMVASLQR